MNQLAHAAEPATDYQENSPAASRRALQRCMRQLVHAGVSALTSRDAAGGNSANMLVQRLTRLQHFLDEDWQGASPSSPVFKQRLIPGKSAPATNPLVELLSWQLRLELAELAAGAPGLSLTAALLRPALRQQLETVARLCAKSLWTPDHFIASGLAQHWRYTRGLALFCPEETARAAIATLEAECLRLHLHGIPPPAICRTALLRDIVRLAEQPFARQPLSSSVALARPLGIEQLFSAELARYRQLLAAELSVPANAELQPGEQLLLALYKLAWTTEACGSLSLAWHCAFQLCSQFWFRHHPLPAELVGTLKRLLALADVADNPAGPNVSVWLCQVQLLRHWPAADADASLPISLAATTSETPHVVKLDAVPLLLSDSFATLVQVSREWLEERAAPSHDDLAPLLQELALLEKGAAAVKVWPLEQLCTLLLELYALVERDGLLLPTELLASAHADLVRLLDQAAAWRETSANGAIVRALQQWNDLTAGSRPALSIAAPTAGEIAAAQLYQALLVYVRTLTLVVEKPVRLHVDPDNEVLPPQVVLQVTEALKPLLRFVLLDNASAAWSRRAAHKPLVHTLSIHLRREAGALWIMLAEDNEGPLLTPAQTRQLQRSLPPTAGALGCEVQQGQGRWFSFTLKEMSE